MGKEFRDGGRKEGDVCLCQQTEIKKEDKQSIKTIEFSQDEDDTQNDVIDNVVDNEESRELSSDLSPEHDEKQLMVDHSNNLRESVVEESQEDKRQRLFAKRTY